MYLLFKKKLKHGWTIWKMSKIWISVIKYAQRDKKQVLHTQKHLIIELDNFTKLVQQKILWYIQRNSEQKIM